MNHGAIRGCLNLVNEVIAVPFSYVSNLGYSPECLLCVTHDFGVAFNGQY